MRLHRTVRMQAMLMGLGAVLLLASAAHAQQDMDPTDFPVNPGTPKVERNTDQQVAQSVAPAVSANKMQTESVASVGLWNRQSTQEETDFNRVIAIDAAVVMIMMAGVVAIVLYAKAATKRERYLDAVLPDTRYGPVSGATTH
jgi:hypothetical protein